MNVIYFYGQDLKLMYLIVYIHDFTLFKILKDVSTLTLYTPLDAHTLNPNLSFEIDLSISLNEIRRTLLP